MVKKAKSMMERIQDSERVGYAYFYPGDGGKRQEFHISTTPKNLANFLGSHYLDAERMIVTDIADRLILDTIGGYIDNCPDQRLYGKSCSILYRSREERKMLEKS